MLDPSGMVETMETWCSSRDLLDRSSFLLLVLLLVRTREKVGEKKHRKQGEGNCEWTVRVKGKEEEVNNGNEREDKSPLYHGQIFRFELGLRRRQRREYRAARRSILKTRIKVRCHEWGCRRLTLSINSLRIEREYFFFFLKITIHNIIRQANFYSITNINFISIYPIHDS